MKLQRGKFLINNISELENQEMDKDGLRDVISLSYMNQFEYEGNVIPISRMIMEYYKDRYIFYHTSIFNYKNEEMILYIDSYYYGILDDYATKKIDGNMTLWLAINEEEPYDFWWDLNMNSFIFFGEDKIDIIKYFIDSCYERDMKGEGITKKLEKVGYRIN